MAAAAGFSTRDGPGSVVGAQLKYGILVGAVAATASAAGYALHLEHVGWVVGSALLVMRPTPEQMMLRAIGRSCSVVVGALAAAALASLALAPIATAIAVGAAIAAMAATQGSRWYITPAFTTFIVLTMLAQVPGEDGTRLFERVTETFLGVVIALIVGTVTPAAFERIRRARMR